MMVLDRARRHGRRCSRRRGSLATRAAVLGAALVSHLALTAAPARAAGVNSLQSGTVTMTAGAGPAETVNVTITAVDMSKSILFFNFLGDSDAPEDGRVRGQLTTSTNIQFYRPNDSSLTNLTIKWFVVEFACGVSVQRGLANTADTTNVTINAVDMSKSFVLTSSSESGSGVTYNNDDYVRARLTSSTNLEVSGLGSPANEASWQVVEYGDASVQRGVGSLTGTSTSTTVTITAVDLTKSIVLLNWKTNIDGTGANFLRAYFSSTTEIKIDRAVGTSATIDFAWEVVRFTDATSVQSGSLAFDTSQTSRTATLTAVDLTTSVPLLSTAGGTWGGTHTFASDDRTGPGMFTTVLTNSTTLTATRQLTESVTADIAWFVISFQPVYRENFQTWSSTSAGAWQTKSLSGAPFNVPANAVVEVAVRNPRNVAELSGGVRAVGSTLDRRLTLMESEANGITALVMHAQADASSQIQHYSETTAYVDFALLGFWTCGTYVERFDTFAAGANASWVDKSLCSFGLGSANVAEIVMTNDDPANPRSAGVRTKGSALDRRVTVAASVAGGVAPATMFVKTDTSQSANVQVYAQDDTDVDFYLAGYWSNPAWAYTELITDVGSPSSSATWQDKDLTASGVPDKAIAEFLLLNRDTAGPFNMGVRTNGSSLTRLLELHKAAAGGGNTGRMHVSSDASAIIEFYHADITKAHTFNLTGYWKACDTLIEYVITDLGAITSTKSSLALAINATGKVVGSEEDGSGNPVAWYVDCGTFTSLGALGGSYAAALGLNDSGKAVGWALNGSGDRKPFTWTGGGGMVDLGTASGRTDGEAVAVNASGEVVGTVSDITTSATHRLAFIYLPVAAHTLSSGMTTLAPFGSYQSQAMDINDSGQVVGGAENTSGYFRPFRWENGTMTNLGTLGGESGRIDHRAQSVNSAGDVVGRSYTAGGAAHAFLYTGSMTDLGVLTGGDESWAFGINASRTVVGTSNVTGGAFHAFVWDSTNGMRDLNNLIPGGSGWTLTRATDIRDDGTIVGWGTNPSSDVRAFLLTPSCSAGGGGSAATFTPVLARAEGIVDEVGDLNAVAVTPDGDVVAEVQVREAEAGAVVELVVDEPGPDSDGRPIPDPAAMEGFRDGIALPRTAAVSTGMPSGTYLVTVSLVTTAEELADLNVQPAEVELHVLETHGGLEEERWVPAGLNVGSKAPTGVLGESGFMEYRGGKVEYWAVRNAAGIFAIGAANAQPADPEPVPPRPRVCGLGMMPALALMIVGLRYARVRTRRVKPRTLPRIQDDGVVARSRVL